MAGMIPRTFIDQLIARIDIVDIVGHRVTLKKHGREYQACCPFHNEKTPSFTVSQTKQFYHCFGCGAHGTAVSFVMEFEKLDYVEAIEVLAQSLGWDVPREQVSGQVSIPKKVADDIYATMQQVAEFYQAQLGKTPPAQTYIAKRGLSAEIAERFGLGYSPDAWEATALAFPHLVQKKALLAGGVHIQNEQGRVYDRFRGRLMFPIRDRRGRVIGFGGRVIGEGTPKYLNSPETELFHKGSELYGFYEARMHTRKLERLLVVEGYMDVIALAQFGVSYAVATLGTATTLEHIRLLFKSVNEVIFCFDGDRAGKQAAWRALEVCVPELGDAREVRFLFLPEQEDPDSWIRAIGQAAFEAECQKALPLSDYFLQGLAQRHNASTREGKSGLFIAAQEYLIRMPDSDLKTRIVAELVKKTSSMDLPAELIWSKVKYQQQPIQVGKADMGRAVSKTILDDVSIRRSPIRFAIAVLLNYPQWVGMLGNPEQLVRYPLQGIDLLLTMVEIIEEQPHISTAGVLERLRSSRYENILSQLMAWQPQLEDEAVMQQEFRDCLQQIRQQALKKQLEDLLHRKQTEALTMQEQHDLRSLLTEIHARS